MTEPRKTTPRKTTPRKTTPRKATPKAPLATEETISATEAPAVDALAAEAPPVDALAAEAPAVDAPAINAPDVDAPVSADDDGMLAVAEAAGVVGAAAADGTDDAADVDDLADADDQDGDQDGDQVHRAPRWFAPTIFVLGVVIIFAAIVGAASFMSHQDHNAHARTAQDVTAYLNTQGAAVETVDCDDDACTAIIQHQAYTVVIVHDDQGKPHYGVSAYTGSRN